MSGLPHEQILAIHRAAVACEIYRHRDVLLTGLDREIIAGLPVGLAPSAQLLSDLGHLNQIQLAEGSNPLGTWLANAVALAGSSDAAKTLGRAADSLRAFHPERAQESHSPTATARFERSAGQRAEEGLVERTVMYEDRWRRAALARPGLSAARAAVLYVLSSAKKPLDGAEIARLSGVPVSELLPVLDEWRPFVHSRERAPEELDHFIVDDGFRAFLYWQDDVQAAGVEVSGARAAMADSLSVLFGEE